MGNKGKWEKRGIKEIGYKGNMGLRVIWTDEFLLDMDENQETSTNPISLIPYFPYIPYTLFAIKKD